MDVNKVYGVFGVCDEDLDEIYYNVLISTHKTKQSAEQKAKTLNEVFELREKELSVWRKSIFNNEKERAPKFHKIWEIVRDYGDVTCYPPDKDGKAHINLSAFNKVVVAELPLT